MALFNYNELQNEYISEYESYDYLTTESRARRESNNVSLDSIDYSSFDIFLSHSYSDREIIPALKKKLENFGFSVYVDWITDHLLSRESVTKETAQVLQKRMSQSKCLIYATSENSSTSKWMPWELGYFDGIKDKMVGILPLKKCNNGFQDNFKGEEYLSLYYYIDENLNENNENKLWVREDSTKYVLFNDWINGTKPYSR